LQTASVKIMYPLGYRAKPFSMVLADFGKPKYGGTLQGSVVYWTEDPGLNPWGKPVRCKDGIACQYACSDLVKGTVPAVNVTKLPGRPLIFLVDRGPRDAATPCYFLLKAYNAQAAGADAVLVVNDEDGDLSTAVVPDEEGVAQLLDKLAVSAALISRADGALVKDLLRGQAAVTLALNWTDIMPRNSVVSWELWGNSNDECGALCREQLAFVHAFKPYARALEQAGAATFTPHYIIYTCPPEYMDGPECASDCYLNGTYCTPDPDGSYAKGYSGQDVLAINVRQLCMARVARAANSSWLWWDYVDAFASSCTTAAGNYTPACAQQVFASLGGPGLLGGQGQAKWDECIASGTPVTGSPGSPATSLPLFEQELAAQRGPGGDDAVSILPTLRINGRQYRGSLDVASVMRALCSAYPLDREPPVCNEKWVAEDECAVGGPGYAQCRVGDPLTGGHTRCVNTFNGYRCECSNGWVKSTNADTGEEVCEDLNECIATNVRTRDPKCSCPRCVCVNTPGSYKCTGELPNKCAPEYDWGGCWRATASNGSLVTACVDTLDIYSRLASRGALQPTDQWYTCRCPACFRPPPGSVPTTVTCEEACPMSRCLQPAGICLPPPDRPPSGGGGKSSGVSWMAVLLAVALTAAVAYGLYVTVLRARMRDEIRDIMSQYMPLEARLGGARGEGRAPHEERAPLLHTGDNNRHGGRRGTGNTGGGGYEAPQVALEQPPAPRTWGPPPTSSPQRTPFGSLLADGADAGAGAGPAAAAGQGAGASRPAAALAPAKPAAPAAVPAPAEAKPQDSRPLVDDAPLLGDGPL